MRERLIESVAGYFERLSEPEKEELRQQWSQAVPAPGSAVEWKIGSGIDPQRGDMIVNLWALVHQAESRQVDFRAVVADYLLASSDAQLSSLAEIWEIFMQKTQSHTRRIVQFPTLYLDASHAASQINLTGLVQR